MKTKTQFAVLFCLLIALENTKVLASPQDGVSTMSLGMMRAGVNIFDAQTIKVEEFFNYHRHKLPRPGKGEPLSLNVKSLEHDGRTYIQVGLAAPREVDRESGPDLNLVIVVDVSGSMSGGNRIERVRKGLMSLVEKLRPDDKVSLVTFSDEACLVLKPCRKTDLDSIQSAINKLQPTQSTNLHAGLMLGYQTARKNFDEERSNRVILLTDGIANVGVTDPKQIASESAEFNRRGIDLSTIGVGKNLNHELLRELATAGRGAVHFVDDQHDLTKCFVDEVDSLLFPVARNIKVLVDGINGIDVKIFGYDSAVSRDDDELAVKLENMSCDSSQLVLLELDSEVDLEDLGVTVQFKDAKSGKKKSLCSEIKIGSDKHDKISNGDFEKNLAIAFVARSIRNAVDQAGHENWQKGKKTLRQGMKKAKRLFSEHDDDEDFQRVAKIAEEMLERCSELSGENDQP